MSDINIGTKMRTLDVGQRQAAYTGVVVHSGQSADGEELVYSVGDDTGSVLDVNVPNGSYALACALLDKLKLRGYRYQPFEADDAIADPAIEIGDNITANNVPSIVMGIQTKNSRLMASTLKAPFGEEANHEWKYVPRSERQFQRESAYTRSRLTINDDRIEAKVSKTGGSAQSFGWSLTDSEWTLTSNNSTVLRATSAGIEVTGKIVATSGNIGGATIENGVLTVKNANIESINGSKVIDGTLNGAKVIDNTMSGSKLVDNTTNGSKLVDYSIGRYKYGTGSIYGGSGGAIAGSTVSEGNVTFPGTLTQVGINTSDIAGLKRGNFGALACTSLVIGDWQIVITSGGAVYGVSVN